MYDIYDLPKSIPLGRQGEQYARAVEIDCAKMLSDYPGARLTLMQRRTRGETARIVKADVSDTGVITWSPDMDAMAVAGLGAIEIVATVDDKVAKSVIAATAIAPSLTPPDTDTQSGWVKDVLDASDAAQGAMVAAQESAAAAAGSASAAQSSANAAAGSASAASKSATSAAKSADAASGSASAAAQSAAEADASAKASAASAAEAAGTLDSVKESADAAAASARAAAESASGAASSKSSAAQSAADAAGSASAAAGSASQSAAARDAAQAAQAAAGAAASDAAGSATAAAGSKDAAAQSASAAAASAEAAGISAQAAAQSAQGAAEAAKVEAAKIIQDSAIARTSTWSSQKIVDQLYQEVSASGNPAVIENALEGCPMSVKASWGPKQDGSGTPSPDNVRPIKGRESVKITANGTEHTLALPNTIYSGEVDAVTGEGNADTKIVTVDGNKIKFTANGQFWQLPQYSVPKVVAINIVSHFPNKLFALNARYEFIFVTAESMNPYFATIEEFNTYLSAQYAAGTPMQIAYKLAAPESFAATGGGRIDALAGTNTIVTDADSVEVKAYAKVARIIDDTVIAEDKAWSSKHTVDELLPMQTVTGNPAVIETLEGYPLELSASWEPKQDGSGTPSPDNVRPITGTKLITLRESNANLLNSVDIVNQTFAPYNLQIKLVDKSTLRIKGTWQESEIRSFVIMELNNKLLSGRGLKIADTVTNGTPLAHTLYGLRTRDETAIALATAEGGWPPGTAVDMTIKVGVYAPEAVPAEYQPYAGKQFLLTLPRAIYGGIIDTITGQGKETWGYIASYAGETLPGEWISDRDEYAEGTAPTVGAQVAYKLATPVPFTALGGQTALALAGTNVIITDADILTATAPTPPQTTASAAEAQAAKLDYIAMMADVDMDDLTAVDDAGADAGMYMDMPTGIEGSETDGEQEV